MFKNINIKNSHWKMKIIFLDIDGVLNTDKWEAYMLSQRLPLEDEFGIFFDKEAINNLAKILTITKAKIVIHSTWKLGKPLEWLQLLWNKRRLPGHIFDITPDIPPYYNKDDEITEWLVNHSEVNDYVILDDEAEFSLSLNKHFVQINSTLGITKENVIAAIILLKQDNRIDPSHLLTTP